MNCLETALRLRPDEESVFESLETIYTETGSWQKLVDLLKARLGVENEPQVVETLRLRIARLESNQLGEPKQAFQEMLEAFEENPSQGLLLQLFELAIPIGESQTVYTAGYDRLVEFGQVDLLLRLAHELLSSGSVEEAARCFLAGGAGGADIDRLLECFDVLALSTPCMKQLAQFGQVGGLSEQLTLYFLLGSVFRTMLKSPVELSKLPVSLLRDGVRRLAHTSHLRAYRAWLEAVVGD